MLKTTLGRILRSGWMSFRRNGWLSTATVTVMTLALFVLGNLIFLGALAQSVLLSLESKIDISVYFVPDAPNERIAAVRREIESIPDVAEVGFVSREQALAEFQERHKNNALILEALNELDENPLQASLNIRARDPENYGAISEFLRGKNYQVVDKINYFENRRVIDRLSAIVSTTRGFGGVVAVVLAFVAVLVAFNTIRLAIYTMREEIGIMRLVGATAWFIRGPFLVSGVLYGLIAAGLTTLIFFPIAWFISPKVALLVPDFYLFGYFTSHFGQFFGIMLVSGVGLGAASSFIAIRRYLRV